MTRRAFGLIIAVLLPVPVFCQNAAPVDLNSPALSQHADLPRYNRGGQALSDSVAAAHVRASASGRAWQGIDFILHDEPNVPSDQQILSGLFQKLTCSVDAIVIGQPNSFLSHISGDGTTVYTDYDFVIGSVLKGRLPNVEGSHIVVTRMGGTFLQASKPPLKFDAQEFPPLQHDVRYALFLRRIPQTGAYEFWDSLSTLVATGADWRIARQALSTAPSPVLMFGTLEQSVDIWRQSCK